MRTGRILVVLWGLLLFEECQKRPEMDAVMVREMITHRNLGLAYLEDGKLQDAAAEFQTLVEIAPWEPLGHANLGLTYLRMTGELEQAEKWLKQALKLEPDHAGIRLLLAKVYELTDRRNLAIEILEKSLKRHPNHVYTLYQLAQYFIPAQDPQLLQKAEGFLGQVVSALPANVGARLQLLEVLIENGKLDQALQHMETIRQILPKLPEGSMEIFQGSLEQIRSGSAEQALAFTHMFHNLMKPTSLYQAGIIELRGTAGPISGEPIYRFSHPVSLPVRELTGIPGGINFVEVTEGSGLNMLSSEAAPAGDNFPQTVLAVGDYDGDGDPDVFVSRWESGERTSRQYLFSNENGQFSQVPDQGGISHGGRDYHALFADVDNDGHLDLFVTNDASNRLYRNMGEGAFEDVTASSGIGTVAEGHKAVFADLDHDGDLDLFIASSFQNQLYRNNSDGTFTEIGEDVGIRQGGFVPRSRDVAYGDFDGGGVIDLFVVNEDTSNQYLDNLRQGYFRDISEHTGLRTRGGSGAVAVGDYDNDGYLDLFVTDLSGREHTLFRNRGDGTFERDARAGSAFESITGLRGLDAVFFDADNDGFLDLLVTGIPEDTTRLRRGLWLFYNSGEGKYLDASSLLPETLEGGTQLVVTDYDSDGDLDIFLGGFRDSVHLLRNDGGNLNNYLAIRLAGLRVGSSRNNYFGIGAKVEVKAGTLYQMRVMTDAVAHFGLGNREGADVVRVVWSNGVAQNRFNPERNQTIVENQLLKGSCPWLYTWNGGQYEFVTDVLWPNALGMPLGIMGGETRYGSPNSTDEYLKIPGEKLQARGGKYVLQFTSELWETPYVDRLRLLVVDHPDSMNIFVDERFTPPPYPALRIYAVSRKRLPAWARDGYGNDLLEKIAYEDGDYVSNLIPAAYQGVTEPHDLVLDLGDLSQADSIFLFLQGWIFPTDASINVNMAQSGSVRSIPPFLQVIDEQGKWKTIIENVGFPKGKNKTVVVDLTGRFLIPTERDSRIRIRTNMQIYWDRIFYTTGPVHTPLSRSFVTSLEPTGADLHYRGFSKVTRQTPYSPHIPDYQAVTPEPRWRDLTGLYTRYGDVLPLLQESDSKYVIMNAGDELTIQFDASQLPALAEGWARDFIFYVDGWLKDGDLNTALGQTVEPLPFHGMTAYPYGPAESYPRDPEYLRYLETYNTRKVTPEAFRQFLLNFH